MNPSSRGHALILPLFSIIFFLLLLSSYYLSITVVICSGIKSGLRAKEEDENKTWIEMLLPGWHICLVSLWIQKYDYSLNYESLLLFDLPLYFVMPLLSIYHILPYVMTMQYTCNIQLWSIHSCSWLALPEYQIHALDWGQKLPKATGFHNYTQGWKKQV